MPASYIIDKERRLVMSSGTGVLTKGDILGHMDRITKDPDFDPDFSQVIDFTRVTAIEFGSAEVREFAERKVFSPKARRAILVKDNLQFGLARMFEIHREFNGETGIRVFRARDEAMDWVLAPKLSS
jgi:hypothetical protein